MFRTILLVSLIATILISCASQATPPGVKEITGAPSSIPDAQGKLKQDWEIKWDKVVQEAKKEGKVVVYGAATGQIRDALMKAFTEKYSIPVEYMAAKGPEIAARLTAERRANLYIPDAIIGASSPSISILKPAGFFDPMEPILILPEVTDPKVWWENKLPWVDKDHYFVGFLAYARAPIVINGDLVKIEEIKSYNDLLAPKWKGKLAMHDPTIAGSAQAFIGMIGDYMMGVDYLRKLAGQEPFISRDHRLLAEWVARGKYPIGIAIEPEGIEQLRTAGMNLQYLIPAEGTQINMGTGFLSRPKGAPHPNASILFINWLLSKDGQIAYTDIARTQSARADLPLTNLDQTSIRQPGVEYFNSNTEEFWLKGPDYLNMGKEIFGNLIK